MTGDLGTATIDSVVVLAAALPSDIKVFSLSAKAVVTVDVDVSAGLLHGRGGFRSSSRSFVRASAGSSVAETSDDL
jgi:hypothetical protein